MTLPLHSALINIKNLHFLSLKKNNKIKPKTVSRKVSLTAKIASSNKCRRNFFTSGSKVPKKQTFL